MKDAYQLVIKVSALAVGLLVSITALVLILVATLLVLNDQVPTQTSVQTPQHATVGTQAAEDTYRGVIPREGLWKAPDWSTMESAPNASLIAYGRELIVNTSELLGPNGKVLKISNGMDCQNCHLDAGTSPLGNNYSAVSSTYPKVRGRSGVMEDIPKRINDCFERSLNGQPLKLESGEMHAMVAYMEWLGKEVPKGEKPKGSGIYELAVLDRAADPIRGKAVYAQQCQSCHMEDGQGMKKPDHTGYVYPPLWGPDSYNNGAGIFRLSRFAGYVKTNMPLGATFERPLLTDEQAWDVAAFVNSMDRPKKDLSRDWPDISKKPMDHPFSPFSDEFTEEQHKFGPFKPIIASRENPIK